MFHFAPTTFGVRAKWNRGAGKVEQGQSGTGAKRNRGKAEQGQSGTGAKVTYRKK